VLGAVGADGRAVDEPVVVPGAVLSATRGPLHGAHINKRYKHCSNERDQAGAHTAPPIGIGAGHVIAVEVVIIQHFHFLLDCPQMQPLQNAIVPMLHRVTIDEEARKGDERAHARV
jgi:hypothetical protein